MSEAYVFRRLDRHELLEPTLLDRALAEIVAIHAAGDGLESDFAGHFAARLVCDSGRADRPLGGGR